MIKLCLRSTTRACSSRSVSLTVGAQEGRREEAVIHEGGERNNPDHVVRLKGQAREGLRVHLLSGNNKVKVYFSQPALTNK